MIHKVIYIGYQPLTEKVIEDFYFQQLLDKCILVEYWDLSAIYFPNILKNSFFYEFNISIKSLNELENIIKHQNIETTLFITNISYEYRVLTLYRILSKNKCKTSFFARGALPNFSNDHNLNNWIIKLRKLFNYKLLLKFIKNKFAYWLKIFRLISPHLIVFRAGNAGLQTIGLGFEIEKKKSNIININYFDFDRFIKNKDENIFDKKYCVYLDEYLPFHPDFLIFGIRTIEPNDFYFNLNKFFDLIEEKYSVKVIIASHPKAENYKEINYFNGREIYFNKTDILVKYSEFTIAHCSTSLSYAILNYKPIISLVSKNIKEVMPNYYNYIKGLSIKLGSSFIDIDEIIVDNFILNYPSIATYCDYKYDFLTSKESETKYTSEIFLETILNL
jgi:hypothetical protein